MKTMFPALLVASALTLSAALADPLTATVTIRGGEPGTAVSPLLYGLFYEDINYSADGGLYAEMVQNRSFDYHATPGFGKELKPTTAWEPVNRGGRTAEFRVEIYHPQHAHNPNYALVMVKGDAGEAGVPNTGFGGGFSVTAGAKYDVSLYAKRHGGDLAPLKVSLESATGTVLASAELKAPGDTWEKQETVLTPSTTDKAARLVITTASKGAFLLDLVSVFPQDTFKGRKNGLRKDLAEAIAAINAKVLRFPGGCLVHGTGLDNAYRWKETVGPLETRRGKWNRWGYHQTFGLGYFEYFQFCQDIGAEPLPILPAGVSCGFAKPFDVANEEVLQDMIQDAIDLVEFANGAVTTKWGKLRAEMGHPEPFGLKYVGLGNEEHDTKTFRDIFPRFVKALRAKHPEIQIVGTSGLGPGIPLFDLMEANQVEISDEHYYEKPEWFVDNRNRFDSFPRGKTKIFVGEYASQGNKHFNAVAEAVYLTGIERNADHVVMGAYAPLLARYDFTQWKAANLIWFDNDTVVRTPSYWVQHLFANHIGDRYLPNTVTFPDGAQADGKPPVLAVSPTLATKSGTLFVKLANPTSVPVTATVNLEGLASIGAQAELTELVAAKDAQNNLQQPDLVSPKTREVKAGKSFVVEVPPYAVQVLKVSAKAR
jgi:alpha-L-arabinofuranosidase